MLPNEALIPAVVLIPTTTVLIVNGGETVWPANTVTDACGWAISTVLLSVTSAPPAGAGALRVTVLAVEDVPPATLAGDRLTDLIVIEAFAEVAAAISKMSVSADLAFRRTSAREA